MSIIKTKLVFCLYFLEIHIKFQWLSLFWLVFFQFKEFLSMFKIKVSHFFPAYHYWILFPFPQKPFFFVCEEIKANPPPQIMCSETSPRVSFSHDLSQPTMGQHEQRRDTTLLEQPPCSDFEFNICSTSFDQQQWSSADELFANGMLLPKTVTPKHDAIAPSLVSLPPRPKLSMADDARKDMVQKKPVSNKSFWGFKRSSSLNCDVKKGLICSLPLLSRSNSTGSVSSASSKHKHSSPKLPSPSSCCNGYQFPQKPPVKKNHGNCSYGNGVRISPVLNVPPPYISKGTANLFGLGSLLRNGKVKKSKKWISLHDVGLFFCKLFNITMNKERKSYGLWGCVNVLMHIFEVWTELRRREKKQVPFSLMACWIQLKRRFWPY